MQSLHEKKILSAPVVNIHAKPIDSWKEKYIGIIDMSLLVTKLMESLEVIHSYVLFLPCFALATSYFVI